MVKPPSFDRYGMKKGAWSQDEDDKLRACIDRFGHTNWRLVPVAAGLKRCGKSCRLRWKNYLMPGLKRGNFTKDEEDLIIELHNQLGNKWSAIAAHFPDRTDNDIKNYFHAHIKKRRGVRPEIVRQEEEAENISGAESINDMGIDLSQLSLKEEIYDHLGLCQNDIMSELLCDYSDSGIGPWKYSNLWSEAGGEEDFFEMELW